MNGFTGLGTSPVGHSNESGLRPRVTESQSRVTRSGKDLSKTPSVYHLQKGWA